MKFFPSNAPNFDFLVHIDPSDDLVSEMVDIGASVLGIGKIRIFTWGISGEGHLLSGSGNISGQFLCGPKKLTKRPERIAGSALVLSVGRSIRIKTSEFGFPPVFYSSNFVTNRLHLAHIVSQSACLAGVASFFVGGNTSFCVTGSTIQTHVAGTKLQLPWEEISIGENGIKVAGSAPRLNATNVHTYKELMRAGAEDVLHNVETALNSGLPLRCGITAGRDSRVVLAALVALDAVDQVKFFTSDHGRDVEFSKLLMSAIGIRRRSPFPTPERFIQSTPEISDAIIRSYHFGNHNGKVLVRPRQLLGFNEGFGIKLVGGCGEVYRGFYKIPPHVGGNEATLKQDLDHFIKSIESSSKASHFSRTLLHETFENLPGENIFQLLDSHYFAFRNRYHFGSGKAYAMDKAPVYSPMESYNLYLASRCLPQEDRHSERVIYDLMRVLCPELLDIPYEKPWSQSLQSGEYFVRDFGAPFRRTKISDLSTRAGKLDRKRKGAAHDTDLAYKFYKEKIPRLTNIYRQGQFEQIFDKKIVAKLNWSARDGNNSRFFLKNISKFQTIEDLYEGN